MCALLTTYYHGEHIEEVDVDGTCGLGWGQVHAEFGLGNLKVNRPLWRPKHRWEDNIKMNLKWSGLSWNGLMWLRTGPSCRHLWTLQYSCGFHKMRQISWVLKEAVALLQFLCGMEWVFEWLGYGLDDRRIEVQLSARWEAFLSRSVNTCPGAHPVLLLNDCCGTRS